MEYYNANIRENNPGYLLKQANELVSLAKTHKNSFCLDLRLSGLSNSTGDYRITYLINICG